MKGLAAKDFAVKERPGVLIPMNSSRPGQIEILANTRYWILPESLDTLDSDSRYVQNQLLSQGVPEIHRYDVGVGNELRFLIHLTKNPTLKSKIKSAFISPATPGSVIVETSEQLFVPGMKHEERLSSTAILTCFCRQSRFLHLQPGFFLYLTDDAFFPGLEHVDKTSRQVQCTFGRVFGAAAHQQLVFPVQDKGYRGRRRIEIIREAAIGALFRLAVVHLEAWRAALRAIAELGKRVFHRYNVLYRDKDRDYPHNLSLLPAFFRDSFPSARAIAASSVAQVKKNADAPHPSPARGKKRTRSPQEARKCPELT